VLGWFKKRAPATPPSAAPRDGDGPLFDEAFLARLESLAIAARKIQGGRTRAERRSRKTGSGIEFADHREYAAGDDFRYLDWNVYGRSERLLVRLFEEEEDLSVYVLLDVSRSMAFGSPSKLVYGKRLAAALAYVALASLDRVSITTFDRAVIARLPPTRGRSRIFRVFRFLEDQTIGGRTGLGDAMRAFVAQNKRRGVALLISDLYDPAGFEEGIDTLRFHKYEPHVLRLVDPVEERPPLHGDVRLVDDETGETREVTVTPRVLDRYQRAHAAYRRRIEVFCADKQVGHHMLRTDVPFDEAVLRVLRRGGVVF
jgi:uncharacterized protein (DUF58 family)